MAYKVQTELAWNGETVKIKGKKVVGKTAFETGLIVQGHAITLAPKDLGRLRGSITVQARARGTQVKAPATGSDKIDAPGDDLEVFVGTAVDYAPFQEFGTARMAAQPFLRPALDLARGKVLEIGVKNGRQEFKDFL